MLVQLSHFSRLSNLATFIDNFFLGKNRLDKSYRIDKTRGIYSTSIGGLSINSVDDPASFLKAHLNTLMEFSIKTGDTILCCHENCSFFVLYASKIVGNKGRVVVFESNENKIRILKKNLRLNQALNVILVDKRLSDHESVTKFPGASNEHFEAATISIDAVIGDSSVKGNLMIMLPMLDTTTVMNGAVKTIRTHSPQLIPQLN